MIQLQENFNFFELQKKGGTGGFKGRGMKQWHSVNLQVPSTDNHYILKIKVFQYLSHHDTWIFFSSGKTE